MVKLPALSRGELEVARAVWTLNQGTAGEVFAELSKSSDMDYATAHTYLRRLEAKGYLAARRAGRNKIYSLRVRRGAVVRRLVDELTDMLFDGEAFALVSYLVRDRGISAEEIRQLRATLSELEAQQHATRDQ